MLAPLQLLRLKQAAHDAVICEIGTRLPAELTVAQWALESGWGSHQPGDNCFGIKVYDGCFGVQSLQTIEEVNGSKSELLQTFVASLAIVNRQASLAAPAPISEPRRVRLRLLTNASLPRVRRWFRASFSS